MNDYPILYLSIIYILWRSGICCDPANTKNLYNIRDCNLQHRLRINDDDISWSRSHVTNNSVVIIHHLPSYSLISEIYTGSYNNLEDISPKYEIWICGHSHYHTISNINDCVCIICFSPSEQKKKTYNRDLVI